MYVHMYMPEDPREAVDDPVEGVHHSLAEVKQNIYYII